MQLTFFLSKIALLLLGGVLLSDGAIWVTTALMSVLMMGFVVFAIESVIMLYGAVSFLARGHQDWQD